MNREGIQQLIFGSFVEKHSGEIAIFVGTRKGNTWNGSAIKYGFITQADPYPQYYLEEEVETLFRGERCVDDNGELYYR